MRSSLEGHVGLLVCPIRGSRKGGIQQPGWVGGRKEVLLLSRGSRLFGIFSSPCSLHREGGINPQDIEEGMLISPYLTGHYPAGIKPLSLVEPFRKLLQVAPLPGDVGQEQGGSQTLGGHLEHPSGLHGGLLQTSQPPQGLSALAMVE